VNIFAQIYPIVYRTAISNQRITAATTTTEIIFIFLNPLRGYLQDLRDFTFECRENLITMDFPCYTRDRVQGSISCILSHYGRLKVKAY
jgi:hypothetical protein